jgi:hypothetical protein
VRAEQLHGLIKAVPFRPFGIVTADGARFEIRHPEWIAHPSDARTAVVMSPDESVRIVDVALVTFFDLGPPIPAGSPAPEPDGKE